MVSPQRHAAARAGILDDKVETVKVGHSRDKTEPKPASGRVAALFGAMKAPQHGIPLGRVLTDRGTEYCGNPERHEYELYLAVEDIDHSWCFGKTPMQTFLDALPMTKEKMIAA